MNTKRQGFLQALGITAYCFLIGLFFGNANKFFPKKDPFLTPVLILTSFSASALICAIIVFYKPYKLFFDGKKKEALEIVVYTALSLFVFAVLTFVGLVIFK